MKNLIIFCFFLIVLINTSSECQGFEVTDSALYLKAKALSREITIVDTHIDLPGWLESEWFDVSKRSDKGEMDYERAVEGGLNLAFMAIYTSPSLEGTGKAKAKADTIIGKVHRMVSEWPDKFAFVRSPSEISDNLYDNKILLAMGMENGSPIENSISNLHEFYNKGIRYITLCHYKGNHICDSANDPERKWNGLSPFGEELIKEMNRLGIMVDISHVSDSTFYDVIRLSKAPVIASHSSLRHFIPGNERNMSDEMIKVLAENEGVIQINFAGFFLVDSIFRQMEANDEHIKNYLETNSINPRSKEASGYSNKYSSEHPIGKASLKDAADHIDHVVKLVGADYVGIGSDYNGVGDNLPVGLEDVSKFPNLIYELLRRGYKDEDIKKIFGGNILRVWQKAEMTAEQMQKN